jgi:hypothetical protein
VTVSRLSASTAPAYVGPHVKTMAERERATRRADERRAMVGTLVIVALTVVAVCL